MNSFEVPFNWVDVAIVVFLILGFFRGRKHGLSQELLITIQWVTIIFACAFGYRICADFLASCSTMFTILFANVVSYLLIAAVVKIMFSVLKRSLHGKLVGSDVFGKAEYPFGILFGISRYICILIFAMALLNAKLVPAAQAQATVASQIKLYDKDYFSTFRVENLQTEVFVRSLVGHFMKDNLNALLITPVEAQVRELHQKEYDIPQ